jgi:hypothetical protein
MPIWDMKPISPTRRVPQLALLLLAGSCHAKVLSPSGEGVASGGATGAGTEPAPPGGGFYLPDAATGSGPASNADAGVSGVGTGPICRDMTTPVSFESRTPDVVIVFDKSGSMNEPFGNGTRLSTELRLLKPLVLMFQDRIRWGFEEFPMNTANMSCPTGCCADRVAPGVAPMNGAAVVQSMEFEANISIRIQTPTAEALRTAAAYYAGLQDGVSERFVLLSTDGEPTCPGPNPCEAAVQAVTRLAMQGVKTIVLGIGDDFTGGGTPSCLDRMAQAGGVPKPGGPPHYYPGSDPPSLQRYLTEITTNLAKPSCVLTLTSAPPDPKKVAVFLDANEVPWDPKHQNGWDYDGPTRIELFGAACMSLQSLSVKAIRVLQGCPPAAID